MGWIDHKEKEIMDLFSLMCMGVYKRKNEYIILLLHPSHFIYLFLE